MKLIKTTTSLIMTLFVIATNVFAVEEMPDPRQFTEVSRAIWKKTTAINNLTESFNKDENDQETIRKTKLSNLKKAADEYRQLTDLYKEQENQANYEALEKKRQEMIDVRADLTKMLTDKVVRSISHIDELQQKFFTLSKSYAELNRLAGAYKDNMPGKGVDISNQLLDSLVTSADTIDFIMQDDPDNPELKTIKAALEGEAKLLEELGNDFKVDVQIQRQSEILKDLTAQLSRVKQSLEGRKNEIRAFAIEALIGDTLTGINLNVPALPPRIVLHPGTIGKEIKELREANGQTTTATPSNNTNAYPALDRARQRRNSIK